MYLKEEIIDRTIFIPASVAELWLLLVDPAKISQWMSGEKIEIEILTSWEVGTPMVIKGNLHGIDFENKGWVLKYEKEKSLSYSHLSSLSKLAELEENFSVIEFTLSQAREFTSLNLRISNFPTESIFRHLDFYWRGTLQKIKNYFDAGFFAEI